MTSDERCCTFNCLIGSEIEVACMDAKALYQIYQFHHVVRWHVTRSAPNELQMDNNDSSLATHREYHSVDRPIASVHQPRQTRVKSKFSPVSIP